MDDIGFCRDYSHVNDLSDRLREVRSATETLAVGLTEEDQCVQSMPDAISACSVAKWESKRLWFGSGLALTVEM